HPSADAEALATAILRGSFEYQGQKCSAASRVFAPASLWPQVRDQIAQEIGEMKMGDVADFSNFVGAVIDASSFATQKEAIEEAKAAGGKASIVAGGGYDDSDGWFVQPFGGARASGTNDKAGSMWNLIRWVSPRAIKETFVPPRDYRYPFLGPDSE